MTYEPAADVRLNGADILNWLVYEVQHDRDSDGHLDKLAKQIVRLSAELAELEEVNGNPERVAALGQARDDLVRQAISRRVHSASSDNPWTGKR